MLRLRGRGWRWWLRWVVTLLGLVSLVTGASGRSVLHSVWPHWGHDLQGDTGRWLLVIVGLAVILIANAGVMRRRVTETAPLSADLSTKELGVGVDFEFGMGTMPVLPDDDPRVGQHSDGVVTFDSVRVTNGEDAKMSLGFRLMFERPPTPVGDPNPPVALRPLAGRTDALADPLNIEGRHSVQGSLSFEWNPTLADELEAALGGKGGTAEKFKLRITDHVSGRVKEAPVLAPSAVKPTNPVSKSEHQKPQPVAQPKARTSSSSARKSLQEAMFRRAHDLYSEGEELRRRFVAWQQRPTQDFAFITGSTVETDLAKWCSRIAKLGDDAALPAALRVLVKPYPKPFPITRLGVAPTALAVLIDDNMDALKKIMALLSEGAKS